MDQEQSVITMAVEAEVVRIVRAADLVGSYRADMVRPYGYKILREAIPGFTRDRWKEITDQEPDISQSMAPEDVAVRETQRQKRKQVRQVERAAHAEAVVLLRQHGEATCCRDCDMANAERLRARLGHVAQAVTVALDEEDEEDEPGCEHTGETDAVQCVECGGTGCGGLNRWGEGTDCETSCPSCDRCEESHPCAHCELDPQCEHAWECPDCGQPVTWERDHWETID